MVWLICPQWGDWSVREIGFYLSLFCVCMIRRLDHLIDESFQMSKLQGNSESTKKSKKVSIKTGEFLLRVSHFSPLKLGFLWIFFGFLGGGFDCCCSSNLDLFDLMNQQLWLFFGGIFFERY